MNKILKFSKREILYAFSITAFLFLSGCKGQEIAQTKKINIGVDFFIMHAYKNSEKKSIKVWTYKPKHWKDQSKIVFVMHGGGRNADDYLNAWVELAQENNLLIVAPEFDNKFKNITTRDYQEGNLFTFFGTKNPKSKWAFTVIENIFDHIKSVNGITNDKYNIFGHSAGGQFVHRMLMFMPESRIQTAIAANAGVYSFPNKDLKYPYGLKKTDIDPLTSLQKSYKKRLIILLGELDNDPSLGVFNTTKLAMKQGVHRLERGTNFYNANKQLSKENGWLFNWSIDTVPNVGHNYKKMSKNAIEWIKD